MRTMSRRTRGRWYILAALILAALLAVVQVTLPLALTTDPMSGGAFQIISLTMFWVGIPGVAGLLTAGLVLIELGRDEP